MLAGALAVAAAIAVPAALGLTATGLLTHFDAKQHDRLTRNGTPQDCHGTKANPGLFGDGLLHSYDKYTFKNTGSTTQCAHVYLQHACFAFSNPVNAFVQANSPFVYQDPSANYLGDAGQSGSPESFSFSVTAGQTFDVVVATVFSESDGPLPCPYALSVQIGGVEQKVSAPVVVGATD